MRTASTSKTHWVSQFLVLTFLISASAAVEQAGRANFPDIQVPNVNIPGVSNAESIVVPPTCGQVCTECLSACPSYRELKEDETRCEALLRVASSKYVTEAMAECRMSKCAKESYKQFCNFPIFKHRGTMDDRKIYTNGLGNPKRRRFITEQREEYLRRAEVYKKMQKELSNSVNAEEKAYNERILKSVKDIEKTFHKALQIRSNVIAARKRAKSKNFRADRMNSTQLRLERVQLRERADFWDAHREAYELALHSSSYNLKKTRDDMAKEYKHIAHEAALLKALKSEHLPEDERANALIILRKRAEDQISRVMSITATLRSQKVFIKMVQTDIIRMLDSIKVKLEQRRVHVPCGPLALSEVLTNALVSGE